MPVPAPTMRRALGHVSISLLWCAIAPICLNMCRRASMPVPTAVSTDLQKLAKLAFQPCQSATKKSYCKCCHRPEHCKGNASDAVRDDSDRVRCRRSADRYVSDWRDPPPGFVEADLVAHSGTANEWVVRADACGHGNWIDGVRGRCWYGSRRCSSTRSGKYAGGCRFLCSASTLTTTAPL